MANDNNLILNLPFDETDGSTVAYDYAPIRHDAEITNCHFAAGKQGNCLQFDGNGYATVNSDLITFGGNFTILAWVKTSLFEDGCTGKRIGVLCNTAQLEGYREMWLDVQPDSWGFIAIQKSGNTVRLYLDTVLMQTVTLPATLTGIALLQDIYSTENAYGYLDEVKVYNVALSADEIAEQLNSVAQLEYYLGGVNFNDLDLHVQSSSGIVDLPKLKAPAEVEWADYHGKVIDLSEKRYQEREITLNCWLRASGKMDFVQRVNRLIDLLRGDGTTRLMISIHPTKPLVYEVYNEDGLALTKRWHDDKMIGTFTIKLKEPDPVKRVVRHQRLNASSSSLTIQLSSDKMVNVYWGDGSVTEDVYGENVTLTHTYAKDGIYYAIVGGVIEDIKDFSTNGIVVWNRL